MWPRRINGFTQVELMMALAVISMASVVGFEAVRQNVRGFQRLALSAETTSQESAVLALMRSDFRMATLRDENFNFVAIENEVQFVRTGREPDSFWEVGYRVSLDPVTGRRQLWRRLEKNVDEDSLTGGDETLLRDDVGLMEVSYFDGSSWLKTWGKSRGIRGLPLAVRLKTESTETIFPVMVSVLNWRKS